MHSATLTEQQQKWFASLRAGLEKATGRGLAEWLPIAATCPETAPRARLRWMKETHGVGQNYATLIFDALAGANGAAPRDPATLAAGLWHDGGADSIRAALQAMVDTLPGSVTGQRKTFISWSRRFAFAAARPVQGGKVRLGLALPPDADRRLLPAHNEGWSERLHASLVLAGPADIDAGLAALVATAHAAS